METRRRLKSSRWCATALVRVSPALLRVIAAGGALVSSNREVAGMYPRVADLLPHLQERPGKRWLRIDERRRRNGGSAEQEARRRRSARTATGS